MAWGYGICGACCTPPPNTTVAGTLRGCNNTGVPGTITISNGMTTLWTGATASNGTYTSASFYLATTTTLTITGLPDGVKFTTGTSSSSISVGTNTNKNVSGVVASGYTCTTLCAYPANNTLTLTSLGTCGGTAFPSDTLVWSATPPAGVSALAGAGWYGSTAFSISGQPPGNYFYEVKSTLGLQYVLNPGPGIVSGPTPITVTCGGKLATDKMSYSFTCGANGIGCTISE